MEVEEGGVTVEVPEQAEAGVGDAVFFNPRMELNRDITVAALRAYRDREPRASSYLDATAASGVRGVRAAADGWDVTLADVDPDAAALCRANLARNGLDGTVVERDARALLYDSGGFDVTDLDPFGTPMPFAAAAFENTRDLVCATATDTAPLCGAHFESGVRTYAAVPRNTEYHAEVGLRVLVGALARTAARRDVGVRPLLSHASDHYARTYLELERSATAADDAVGELGHVHHCRTCMWRTGERGLVADPPDRCGNCGADVETAGPLWLGATRDPAFVGATRAALDDGMGCRGRAERLLDRVGAELDGPTHYDVHELAAARDVPAPATAAAVAALRRAGHSASRAHYSGTALKTTADVATVGEVVFEREDI